MPSIIAIPNGLDNGKICGEIRGFLLERGITLPFTFRKIGENFRGDLEFIKVFVEGRRRERKLAVRKFGPGDFGVSYKK